jgi:hypothetical protein
VSTTTTFWWLFLLPFLSLSQAERRRESAEGKEGRKEGRKKRKIRLKLYATHPIPLHLAQTTDSL